MTYDLQKSPQHQKLIDEFNYWLDVARGGRPEEREQAPHEMARVQELINGLVDYETKIHEYALKCIEINPEDPTAESMEFANGEFEGTPEYIFLYTQSKTEAEGQWDDPTAWDYDNCVATDCVDWDICKEIRRIQESETN